MRIVSDKLSATSVRVMQTLWLAIFLYSVGLGIVLQVRPSLMFHANGTWKEFGYQRGSRYTLFPVWLFAIVWAFVSYAIAYAVGTVAVGGAVAAAATYNYEEELPPPFDDVEEQEEFEIPVSQMEMPVMNEPVRRPRGRPRKTPYPTPFPSSSNILTASSHNASQTAVSEPAASQPQPRPGYYVLDPASEANSLRRYIYYGSTPPPDAKDVVLNQPSA